MPPRRPQHCALSGDAPCSRAVLRRSGARPPASAPPNIPLRKPATQDCQVEYRSYTRPTSSSGPLNFWTALQDTTQGRHLSRAVATSPPEPSRGGAARDKSHKPCHRREEVTRGFRVTRALSQRFRGLPPLSPPLSLATTTRESYTRFSGTSGRSLSSPAPCPAFRGAIRRYRLLYVYRSYTCGACLTKSACQMTKSSPVCVRHEGVEPAGQVRYHWKEDVYLNTVPPFLRPSPQVFARGVPILSFTEPKND